MVECEVCSRTFAASDHLKQHILASSEHSPEHLALSCRRCNCKVFTSATSKQQHLLGSSKHFICALCPKHWDFETKNQLKRHFHTKHLGHSPEDTQLIAKGFVVVTEAPRKEAARNRKTRSRSNTQQQAQVATALASPLDRFFALYPSFRYDASLPPATSYHALVQHFGWDRHSKAGSKAKARYQEALSKEVEVWFGKEDDLEAWHTLCRAVGVRRPPNNIEGCAHVGRHNFSVTQELRQLIYVVGSSEDARQYRRSY